MRPLGRASFFQVDKLAEAPKPQTEVSFIIEPDVRVIAPDLFKCRPPYHHDGVKNPGLRP